MNPKPINKQKIEEAIKMILDAIGEDPSREGLVDTPKRIANMYDEIFCGINNDPVELMEVCFTEHHDELVLVKDIALYSMCEHHLLPFYGKAHVAYVPKKGKIVGISKLARVTETYAKRPQLQERLTSQIANCINDTIDPFGVAVVIEAEHMCMTMRGVKKPGSLTVTSAVRGIFQTRPETRAEVFSLINKR
ncbi:GTP cyclohydrolase I [Candidatus Syntrophocurvum alkaliphilum]|uniref:GTP cyclohydrolase 1 n=1 Tax=Candidatus Syntrophocurvum alkaliphilum TaxID=2293317 RepID=A0A6I6DHZ7_9FIRM|nr:GTP cyclohydrolase I FolE [Candidatus Syntrophocurvum alkaliphilum]QGT99883.1 GTP cyclohydrolase I [Candidatus Syntrophocurvum alkaliphilum]